MKNYHFLIFLAVLVFFPKFLGRLMSGLYDNSSIVIKETRTKLTFISVY